MCKVQILQSEADNLFTSDLNALSGSWPPFSLSFPPTIDARAFLNGRGREATGAHAVAMGGRISTEDEAMPP